MADDRRRDEPRPGDPAEGVRIIGAEEAAEAIERGDVAERRGDRLPRYGDRPARPPVGPKPALRFPLDAGADPADAPPVRPAKGIRFDPRPPPAWDEPPVEDIDEDDDPWPSEDTWGVPAGGWDEPHEDVVAWTTGQTGSQPVTEAEEPRQLAWAEGFVDDADDPWDGSWDEPTGAIAWADDDAPDAGGAEVDVAAPDDDAVADEWAAFAADDGGDGGPADEAASGAAPAPEPTTGRWQRLFSRRGGGGADAPAPTDDPAHAAPAEAAADPVAAAPEEAPPDVTPVEPVGPEPTVALESPVWADGSEEAEPSDLADADEEEPTGDLPAWLAAGADPEPEGAGPLWPEHGDSDVAAVDDPAAAWAAPGGDDVAPAAGGGAGDPADTTELPPWLDAEPDAPAPVGPDDVPSWLEDPGPPATGADTDVPSWMEVEDPAGEATQMAQIPTWGPIDEDDQRDHDAEDGGAGMPDDVWGPPSDETHEVPPTEADDEADDEAEAGADRPPLFDDAGGWADAPAKVFDFADEPSGQVELPHWTAPPTGELPRVLAGEDVDEPAPSTTGSTPAVSWQAHDARWGNEGFDDLMDDDEVRVGALDDDRPHHDDAFAFDELDAEDDDEAPPRDPHRSPPPRPAPEAAAPAPVGAGRNVGVAVGVGVGVAAVALLTLAIAPWATLVLVLGVLVVGVAELQNAARRAGYRPSVAVGLLASLAVPLAVYWRGVEAYPLMGVMVIATLLAWHLVGADGDSRVVESVGVTLLGIGWIVGFGSFAALLLSLPDGRGMLFAAIIAAVGYDVGGYAVGRSMGTRSLSDASPNKTWEGLGGGMLVSLLSVLIIVGLFGLAPFGGQPFDGPSAALQIGILAALAAPLGDLCESLIKRDLGVKDMGSLLPEHGGILDRFDALLFVLPAVYFGAVIFDLGPFA